jgi:hypothetical protein
MNVGLTELCRAEYETDPYITIDEICDKYNIERSALGPTNDWQKVSELESEPAPTTVPVTVVDPKEVKATVVSSNKDMIDEFKSITLGEALERIRSEGSEMSVKDMKELVALVDTIDRSFHKSTDANQINIIVQNVISRYVDDC